MRNLELERLARQVGPDLPGRELNRTEGLDGRYPGLLGQLIDHPAVGCVLVRTAEQGALAVNRTGRRWLDRDEIDGADPLAPYGPLALPSLRRLDGFRTVGALVVLSTVDATTAEVVSFEDLVGCHGGLGGAQSEPFVLYPAGWPAPQPPLVGAP